MVPAGQMNDANATRIGVVCDACRDVVQHPCAEAPSQHAEDREPLRQLIPLPSLRAKGCSVEGAKDLTNRVADDRGVR